MEFVFSKIRLAYEHVENRKKLGHSHEDATNLSSIELAQSADAHCRAFLVQTAYEMTKNLESTVSSSLATVIRQFIELYAVDTCMKSIGDLFRVRFFHVDCLRSLNYIFFLKFYSLLV